MNKKQSGFTATELMTVIGLIAWLVIVVGIVWAAVHFISKFW